METFKKLFAGTLGIGLAGLSLGGLVALVLFALKAIGFLFIVLIAQIYIHRFDNSEQGQQVKLAEQQEAIIAQQARNAFNPQNEEHATDYRKVCTLLAAGVSENKISIQTSVNIPVLVSKCKQHKNDPLAIYFED